MSAKKELEKSIRRVEKIEGKLDRMQKSLKKTKEEFDKQLDRQKMADLIEYLVAAVK